MRMPFRLFTVFSLLCFGWLGRAWFCAPAVWCDPPDSPATTPVGAQSPLLTGASFDAALTRQVGIFWSEKPLRTGLRELSAEHGVAIVLDRRIDPDQRLELNSNEGDLRQLLQHVAQAAGGEASFLQGAVYIGPAATAQRLKTVVQLRADELKKLPKGVKTRLTATTAWDWADLAAPQDLLADLADRAKCTWQDTRGVPHDLWAGVELPSLPWATYVALVLAQYDSTFELSEDHQSLVIVPMPQTVHWTATYPGGSDPAALAAAWQEKCPACTVTVSGKRLTVVGRVEDHELLTAKKTSTRPAPVADRRYRLTVKGKTVAELITSLSQQLKLRIDYDAADLAEAGISLDTRVDFEIADATLDQLLNAAFSPAGLKVERNGSTARLLPRGP